MDCSAGVAVPWIAPLEWVSHGLPLSMIYKMGMSAEKSWKRLCGFRQLGKVIEGVKFRDGEEVISKNSREAA